MKAPEALDYMRKMGNFVKNTQGNARYKFDKVLDLVIEMGDGENEMWAMASERFLIDCKDETFEADWDGKKI